MLLTKNYVSVVCMFVSVQSHAVFRRASFCDLIIQLVESVVSCGS